MEQCWILTNSFFLQNCENPPNCKLNGYRCESDIPRWMGTVVNWTFQGKWVPLWIGHSKVNGYRCESDIPRLNGYRCESDNPRLNGYRCESDFPAQHTWDYMYCPCKCCEIIDKSKKFTIRCWSIQNDWSLPLVEHSHIYTGFKLEVKYQT